MCLYIGNFFCNNLWRIHPGFFSFLRFTLFTLVWLVNMFLLQEDSSFQNIHYTGWVCSSIRTFFAKIYCFFLSVFFKIRFILYLYTQSEFIVHSILTLPKYFFKNLQKLSKIGHQVKPHLVF